MAVNARLQHVVELMDSSKKDFSSLQLSLIANNNINELNIEKIIFKLHLKPILNGVQWLRQM